MKLIKCPNGCEVLQIRSSITEAVLSQKLIPEATSYEFKVEVAGRMLKSLENRSASDAFVSLTDKNHQIKETFYL